MINVGQYDMKDGVLQTLEWTKQIQFDNKDYFDQ